MPRVLPVASQELAPRRPARLWEELRSPILGRRVPGTVPVAIAAGLISLLASVWFVSSGLSLAYGDALSHLAIARRLFDTMNNPGLGQLGTVWLPVPHLLLAPFVVWLTAWQSGWGAALLGAGCLAATAAGTYRTGARWGLGLTARLVVVAVVVLNPSMLYLHSTALTEPVLIAGIAGTLAGLSNWATKNRRLSPGELAVFAGIPAAVAVLSRYEGWALVAAGSLFVAIIAGLRDRSLSAVFSRVVGFAAVPSVAILWWVAYNWVTFHDPFAFIFGEYSANALQQDLVSGGLSMKGNLLGSIATMSTAVLTTAGFGTVALAGVGLLVMLVGERSSRRWIFLVMTTASFAFMVFSLWAGQAIIYNPASSDGSVWNNRYGMAAVFPLALVAGFAVDLIATWLGAPATGRASRRRTVLGALVAVVLAGQAVWQLEAPLPRALVLSEAQTQYDQRAGARSAADWLGTHYDGGFILLDESVPANTVLPLAGIPLHEYFLRSNNTLFTEAVADPVDHARWLWTSDSPADAVRAAAEALPNFSSHYQVAFSAGDVTIYRAVNQ